MFNSDIRSEVLSFFNGQRPTEPATEPPTEPVYHDLVISEVMLSNDTVAVDNTFCDWIEIYNSGTQTVDLSEYYISKSASNLRKCPLPEITVAPGEYKVLKCDGTEVTFNLSKTGETVYIADKYGVVVDSLTVPAIADDHSYVAGLGECDKPSPGYENTEEGYLTYRLSTYSGLSVNEVLSTNTKYYPVKGKYYDLIEIRNNSAADIDLADYYISDSKKNLKKYKLPSKVLKPGELYVVIASGNGGDQANFSISTYGECVYITDLDGKVCDAFSVPSLLPDVSYGRDSEGAAYFLEPTIGKENPTGLKEVSSIPSTTVPGGFYDSGLTVKLTGNNIFYTLDGRDPRTYGTLYAGEDIPVQQTVAIRMYSGETGKVPSKTVTVNYFISLPDYTLPVLKITAYNEDIFGETTGIYTNYNQKWEKPANIALYVNGNEEFSVDCGLRLHGSGTRKDAKKSFQVRFRGKYGTSKLKYPLFPGYSITEFNSIVIRSGVEDMSSALFRDELQTTLVRTSDLIKEVYTQNFRPVNLYVNGEYFGIYFIRERFSDDYVASHLNVSENSVTILESKGSSGMRGYKDMNSIVEYCATHDMNDPETIKYVSDRICVDSFIDYYIARAYTGDKDFPNIRFFKSTDNDGKWRLMFYDLDWGFRSVNTKNPLTSYFDSYHYTDSKNSAIIYRLVQNDGIRDRFLKRMAELLSTTFSPENVSRTVDQIHDQLQPDMKYDRERWGYRIESWEKAVAYLKTFGENRTAQMIEDAQSVFKLTDDEIQYYFGSLLNPQQ